MLSLTCAYGIQASLYLAREVKTSTFVPTHRIASELGVPYHFLKKILQRLSEHGITRSVRSTKGGITLAKSADDISIWDIMTALGDVSRFETECLLKLPECDANHPCVMHSSWAIQKRQFQSMLKSHSLNDGTETVGNMIALAKKHHQAETAVS